MPLSATFMADFQSFTRACDDADVKLKTFEQGAGKVETSLNRMANSLSGTKLIQDATLAAEAVDRIGGLSKLTDKELERMGARAAETIEKMKRLGIDVPPGLQKIAAEAKAAAKEHEGLLGTVKDVALGFLAMFTARAAYDFVSKIAEDASALKNLGQQTHINVEELQLLAGAMSEFGVDADTLGKGLYTLSRKIAGGDESVARGLALMGMSLKDVDGLQGKELFLKIESGLATLQGGLRDTAASELYGSRLGMAMAGASEGIGGALESWRRLNTVTSTEAVEALAKADDSVKQAEKSLKAMATNGLGAVAAGFNEYVDLGQKAGFATATWARVKDSFTDTLKKEGTAFDELAAKYGVATLAEREATAAAEADTKAREAAAAATAEQGKAAQFMAAIQINALATITPAQTVYLGVLKEMGALTAANAAAIGVNTAQFGNYQKAMADAEKAAKALEKTQAEAARLEAKNIEQTTKLWEEYYVLRNVHGGTANDIAIAQIDRWATDLTANLVRAGGATKEFYESLAAVSKEKMDAVGVDWEFMRAHSLETLKEIAVNARKTYDEMIWGSQHFTREAMDEQLEKTREAEDAARDMGRSYTTAFNEAAVAAKAAADETKRLADEAAKVKALNLAMGGSFEVTRANFAATARGMGADAGAVEVLLKKGYSFQQALLYAKHPEWPPPQNPGPRVPGFAGGVENFSGGPAVVGERGPELLNLPRGSDVIPLRGLGAGSTTVNLHAGAVVMQYPFMPDAQARREVANDLAQELLAIFTTHGNRVPSGA